jgi:hypothetical protein
LGTPFILFHCSVIKTKPLAVMGPPFGASSAAVGAILAFTAHVCPCPAPGQHRKPHSAHLFGHSDALWPSVPQLKQRKGVARFGIAAALA